MNDFAVITVGMGLASVQPVSPALDGGFWDVSADGGSNGHAIDTEYRFDAAFVLPASRPLSRPSSVGDWLAQSPRADQLDHFDADLFWAEGESPSTRSFATQNAFGWGATPRAAADAWRF